MGKEKQGVSKNSARKDRCKNRRENGNDIITKHAA